MGVAVTANAVYVADTGNNRVQKLSLDRRPPGDVRHRPRPAPRASTSRPTAPSGWPTPRTTAWCTCRRTSTDLGDGFGASAPATTQFFNPHDLAFGNDKMYVADTYNNRVQVFAMPGPTEPPPTAAARRQYRGQISDPGGVAPIYPAGVEIVDGTWYVADSGGSRVVTLNPTTGAVDPADRDRLLNDPRDLEVDAADPTALWVHRHRRQPGRAHLADRRPAARARRCTGLNQPYGLTNDATRVYVANTYGRHGRSGRSVKAYNRNGSAAWTQTDLLRHGVQATARRRARSTTARSPSPTPTTTGSSCSTPATGNCVGSAIGGQRHQRRPVQVAAQRHLRRRRRHVGRRRAQLPRPAPAPPTGTLGAPARCQRLRRRQRAVPVAALRHPDPGHDRGRRLRHVQLPDLGLGRRRRHPDVAASTSAAPSPPTAASTAPSRWPTAPTARSTSPTGSTTGSRSSTPTASSSPQWGGYGPENGVADLPARHRRSTAPARSSSPTARTTGSTSSPPAAPSCGRSSRRPAPRR